MHLDTRVPVMHKGGKTNDIKGKARAKGSNIGGNAYDNNEEDNEEHSSSDNNRKTVHFGITLHLKLFGT